ncbi:MAG TPA: HemK/PrmC family methyltransferase [Burkholderiales bacterium]|nr:HemK/PrmC family methyltransferase [Burkholderiales bacterium]
MQDCAVAPTLASLLAEVERFWTPLPDKPEETPIGVLCALWRTACGEPVSVGRAQPAGLPELNPAAFERLRLLIERKRAGVPLAHLTGRQSFMGLELLAGPAALIPRRETELLGRAALAKIRCVAERAGAARVLDVCTGSGNLALAYAHYEPRAQVYASDLSAQALALAQRNAEHTGLAARVEFRAGDLLEPFATAPFLGACDFVSCNPPYVSTGKVKSLHPEISRFEPEAAFNGGVYGVSILARLVRHAPRFLRPGGWLGFEVGCGQGPVLARQLSKNPCFSTVERFADTAGEVRAILARTQPSP